MWESIKNDPILKTVAVIVLGVLAFGFAFNVMFGSGGGMGHGMEGGGTPLNASLANALSILVKIFLIVLTITAIVVVVKQLKKYLNGENTGKISDTIKKYAENKWIVYGVGLFVLIALLHLVIGTGIRPYGNNMMAGSPYYPVQGHSFNTGISGLLSGLVNILLLLSVIGLAAGLFMYFKTEYMKNLIGTDKAKGQPKDQIKDQTKCMTCGRELNAEWKCCPSCGSEQISKPTETEK